MKIILGWDLEAFTWEAPVRFLYHSPAGGHRCPFLHPLLKIPAPEPYWCSGKTRVWRCRHVFQISGYLIVQTCTVIAAKMTSYSGLLTSTRVWWKLLHTMVSLRAQKSLIEFPTATVTQAWRLGGKHTLWRGLHFHLLPDNNNYPGILPGDGKILPNIRIPASGFPPSRALLSNCFTRKRYGFCLVEDY